MQQRSALLESIIANAKQAFPRLEEYVLKTPLEYSERLSNKYDASVWLKREDYQLVRSFKLRGALNKMLETDASDDQKAVVCASAGNHAQGVAYSCRLLERKGTIFMPETTSKQKISQVKRYGKDWIRVKLYGDTFDKTLKAALVYQTTSSSVFIHPFNDIAVVAGQASLGLEMQSQIDFSPDYLVACVGGGGLISGLGTVFKYLYPSCQVIGSEPAGAPSMKRALEANTVVTLDSIDGFVDGAAVAQVGDLPFQVCKDIIDSMLDIDEGHICSTLIDMYNMDAIVVEPAGALSLSALDYIKDGIKGKHVVVVLSGGNNDILRMPEIRDRSLIYEGLKYYFIIDFPQRAGALRDFLNLALLETDDITMFEYTKKTHRETGPALIGIETQSTNQLERLEQNFNKHGFRYENITNNSIIFRYFV